MHNNSLQQVLAIINPVAGSSDPEMLRNRLQSLAHGRTWALEIHETQPDEDLAQVIRTACRRGASLVIAAGGDGTVSAALNGVYEQHVPVAILPAGTGNGLARALEIPLDLEQALTMLEKDYEVLDIDGLQVDRRLFVLNVSAGFSSKMMQSTPPESKQLLGIFAYIQSLLRDLPEIRPVTFDLRIDHHQLQVEAVEVLVSNGHILDQPPFPFGSRQSFTDGKLEVNIVSASQPYELVRLAWNVLLNPDNVRSELRDLDVKESIWLDVPGGALPVQADGEIIGTTPVEILRVPRAFKVLVPPSESS